MYSTTPFGTYWTATRVQRALATVPGHPAGNVTIWWTPATRRIHFADDCPALTHARPAAQAVPLGTVTAHGPEFCNVCNGPALAALYDLMGHDPFYAGYWLEHTWPWLVSDDPAARYRELVGMAHIHQFLPADPVALPYRATVATLADVRAALAAPGAADASDRRRLRDAAARIAALAVHDLGPGRTRTGFAAWGFTDPDVHAARTARVAAGGLVDDRLEFPAGWYTRVTAARIWVGCNRAVGLIGGGRRVFADADAVVAAGDRVAIRVPELLYADDLPEPLRHISIDADHDPDAVQVALQVADGVGDLTDDLVAAAAAAATVGC